MKLSEQIAQTCCGVLADKQAMVDEAVRLEEQVEGLLDYIDELRGTTEDEKRG